MEKNHLDQENKLFGFIEREKECETRREHVWREWDEQQKLNDKFKWSSYGKIEKVMDDDLRKI